MFIDDTWQKIQRSICKIDMPVIRIPKNVYLVEDDILVQHGQEVYIQHLALGHGGDCDENYLTMHVAEDIHCKEIGEDI